MTQKLTSLMFAVDTRILVQLSFDTNTANDTNTVTNTIVQTIC